MRFAIIGSRGFPSTYGGYETLVRFLARHLDHAGHDVSVYCRTRRGHARTWTVENVRCIATPGVETKSLSTLSYGCTSSIDAAFRQYDAALILNIANGFWMPLLRAARLPFAVNTDGIEWERAKWSPVGRAAFRLGAKMTARLAPELICDSKTIGQIWQREFGRSSTYIPYGAPVITETSNKKLAAAGVPDCPYVLVVARLAPENNVDLTLDALERLGGDAPHAVVVGSASWQAPLEDRLRSLASSGRVTWLGHVADQELLTQLWANAALYIHGHSVGGTNPALLQALGAGAPTVALDTPFNAEIVQDSRFRFAPDAATLAQLIPIVLSSSALRSEMRHTGQQTIADRFTWEQVCQDYTSVLVNLANGRRG
jgi:glycosyltransferase involved in cell wall biosynthesis